MAHNRGLSFGKKQAIAATPDFTNNRAYVIGVNAYSNGIPPLRTAVADAERLGQLLQESHGYQVRSFPRDGAATLATLRKLLRETMPQEVGPDDRVLFYFAGHGIALDGEDGPEGYLVPEDANREDRASFLPMTELSDALAKLPCRHLFLILDCCFAGAFRWSSTRDLSALPPVIHRERYERYIQDSAWQVLTSAAHDQTALDVLSGNTIGERVESDKHSPFAAALFRALAGDADLIPRGKDGQPAGDGVITATELYLYLRECVETATVEQRTRQTPGLWPLKKHDKGEYILLTPGHELNLPPAPELNYYNNPYRGLQSFEEEHRQLFFGRTRVVSELHSLVAANPLTVVLGASGTGKSSVVRAGLLPGLRGANDEDWLILPVIRPGKSPLATLATVALPGEESTEADRLAQLWSDETALADRIKVWAESQPSPSRLLLVVDQFEELVTLCWDRWERERFIHLLASAVHALPNRFRLVITLRSDFEPQFTDCPLKSDWAGCRYVVPPMTTDELREAIEGPASVRVLYFKPPELIDRLIDEVIQTPGAMPLLSFTLSELYVRYLERQGNDRCLTVEDYEQLGGVVGSLRSRATRLYDKLDGAHQATMKRIMLRMVSAQGGELARRRVPRSELVYSGPDENQRVETVLQQLSEARLIVEGREADGEPYVEPAHDALVCSWDKLLAWTRSEQEVLALRRLLTPAANDWRQHRGGLWHANPRLNLVRRAVEAEDQWLNRDEAEFVRASIARQRRVWVSVVGSVAAAFLILSVITVFALVQRHQADQRRIESIQETARLLKIEGEQAQSDGHLQSAMHYYSAALERRAEIAQTDPVSRLRIGVLSAKAPVIRAIIDCPQRPERVTFGPNARRLLTYSGIEDGAMAPSAWVRLWDAQTGRLIATLKDGEHDRVQAAQFSSDGRYLCVLFRFDNRASLWDAERGNLIRYFDGHTGVVNDALFCPDERMVVTSSRDGTARIWDVATGRELRRLNAREGYVYHTRFSPDGRWVATACSDQVRIWDAATSQLLHALDLERGAMDVQFSPDGKRLVSEPFTFFINGVPDELDYRATLWDVESGHALQTFSEVTEANFVSSKGHLYTPRASRAFGRGVRSEGQLWREVAGKFELVAKLDGGVSGIASKQDCFLLIDDEVLRVLDVDDGHVDKVLTDVSMAAIHPQDRLLLTDYTDNTARLWDVRSGVMLTALEGHSAPVLDVTFDSSGDWIATASADDTVRVWQYQPTDESGLVGHTGQVTLARFLKDSPLALTASWKTGWTIYDPPVDGTVRFWDLTTGRRAAEVEDIGGKFLAGANLTNVEYDPANEVVLIESRYIESGNGKSAVRIIDAADGMMRARLEDQSLVGYSPRHQLILTEDDGEIVARDVRSGERRYAAEGSLRINRPQLIAGDRIATIVVVAENADGKSDEPLHYDLQIRDTATGKPLQRLNDLWVTPYMSVSLEDVLFHPNGESMIVIGSDSLTSKIINLVNAEVTGTFEISPYLTEDGSYRGSSLDTAAISADGRFLITVGNLTTIWDSVTGRRIKELVGSYRDDNAATSRLITAGDGQVYVWNMQDWSRRLIIRSANDRITAARLSQDGRHLITGSDAGAVELWDLDTGVNLIRLGSLDSPVSVVVPDPQDVRVLAGSDTGELKAWTVMPELLPTDELADWIAATAGSCLGEGSEQVVGLHSSDWARQRDAAIERLDGFLTVGDLRDRVSAASAILRLSPSHLTAIETLLRALETADAPLSARAQSGLAMADPASDGFRQAVASRVAKGSVDGALAATLGRLGADSLLLLEPLLFGRDDLSPQLRANLVAALKPAGSKAADLLTRAVVDPEPLVRLTAANLLKDLGPDAKPAVPAMIRALGMQSREARLATANALTSIGTVAIPDLIQGLESPAYYTRFNSIAVLDNLKRDAGPAVPALVRVAFRDEERAIRLQAAAALAAIDSRGGSGALLMGGDRYTGRLSLSLLKDAIEKADVEIGGRCIESLAILRDSQGYGETTTDDLFVAALRHMSSNIRDQAAAALVADGASELLAKAGPTVLPHIVKLLKHEDKKVRDRAMMTLWSLIEWKAEFAEEIARSTHAILEARQDDVTAIYAGHALRDLGVLSVPYLIEETSDPSPAIRAEAAFWLGSLEHGADTALPALDKLLADSDELVRLNAAQAILNIDGSAKHVEPVLLNSLKSSADDERRSQAAKAMSGLRGAEAEVISVLTGALNDRSPRVRFDSANTLLQLKAQQSTAIETLQQLLLPEAGDGDVSSDAAHCLGKQGDAARRTIPTLRKGVSAFPNSYNSNQRMSFVRALNMLQAIDELIDILAKESEVSVFHSEIVEDIEKLLAQYPDRVPRIAELLTNEDEDVRELAAGLLASLGPGAKAAIPALEKAASDPSDSVRSSALAAIQTIRAEELLDADVESVRLEAAETALKQKRSSDRIVGVLAAILKDSQDPDLRTRAMEALINVADGQHALAINTLMPYLADERPRVRFEAAACLLALKSEPTQAVAALSALLTCDSEGGRYAAMAAGRLAEMEDADPESITRICTALMAFPAHRNEFIASLAKLKAIHALCEILDTSNNQDEVERILREIEYALDDDPEAVEKLSPLLMHKDPSRRVRGVEMLGRTSADTPRALEILHSFQTDKDEMIREAAKKAIDTLGRKLNDSDAP